MGQTQREIAVIGEEDQSFGLVIEPPDGIHVAPLGRKKVGDDATVLGIVASGDVTLWFVQRDVKFAFGFYGTAVNRHSITRWIDLRAELAGRLAVDFDPSRKHQLLGSAARGDACFGE